MMTRDEWKHFEDIRARPDVQHAMRARCEEQGHEWENCASITLRVYEMCKWCGAVN